MDSSSSSHEIVKSKTLKNILNKLSKNCRIYKETSQSTPTSSFVPSDKPEKPSKIKL